MVFQNPGQSAGVATVVEEDVAFGPENLGVAAGGDPKTRGRCAATSVGMRSFAASTRRIKLSGGQKQRVAIAGIIAHAARMSSYSMKPTAMLDPQRPCARCWTPFAKSEPGHSGIDHRPSSPIIWTKRSGRDRVDRHGRRAKFVHGRYAAGGLFSQVDTAASAVGTGRTAGHGADAGSCGRRALHCPADVLTVTEGAECGGGLYVKDNKMTKVTFMNAAELRGASYIYSARHTRFEKVAAGRYRCHLLIEQGDFITGVIGHTGSGKSTLIPASQRTVKARLPATVSARRRKTYGKSQKNIRQRPFYRSDWYSNTRNISCLRKPCIRTSPSARKTWGLAEEEIDRARPHGGGACRAYTRMLLQKSPFDLSGGQKRRVAIAGVMAMQSGGSDSGRAGRRTGSARPGDDPIEQICRISGKNGHYRPYRISHSMEDMAAYCDKILVMNEARPFLYGTPARDLRTGGGLGRAWGFPSRR